MLVQDCCSHLQATVAELKKAACALFELDEKDVEVCDHYNNKIYASLESPEKAGKRLEEVQISGPQHIFLGEQVSNMHRPLPSVGGMLAQPTTIACNKHHSAAMCAYHAKLDLCTGLDKVYTLGKHHNVLVGEQVSNMHRPLLSVSGMLV